MALDSIFWLESVLDSGIFCGAKSGELPCVGVKADFACYLVAD